MRSARTIQLPTHAPHASRLCSQPTGPPRLQHAATMRTERREVYLEYLRAVENSWSFLDGLWGRQPLTSVDGQPLTEDEVDREPAIRNHEVWYHQQSSLSWHPTTSRAPPWS